MQRRGRCKREPAQVIVEWRGGAAAAPGPGPARPGHTRPGPPGPDPPGAAARSPPAAPRGHCCLPPPN